MQVQVIDEGFAGWYRKYSVIALGLISALSGAWLASPELQEIVGDKGLVIANAALAVFGFVGRFIKQTQGLVVVDQISDEDAL